MDNKGFKKELEEIFNNIGWGILAIAIVMGLNKGCNNLSDNKVEKIDYSVKKIEKNDSVANKIVIEKLNNKTR